MQKNNLAKKCHQVLLSQQALLPATNKNFDPQSQNECLLCEAIILQNENDILMILG